MSAAVDPARLDRFLDALAAQTHRRIVGADVWALFAETFPARPQGSEERAWLLAALTTAAERGVIRLPAPHGGKWDRTQHPAIPTLVHRVGPAVTPRDERWRQHPWHPTLAWVPECRSLAAEQIGFLRRVHDGLRDGAFRDPAPFKYRSLQLTGDEKRLSALVKTALFGPDRLTLAMLGCVADPLPLACEEVGSAPAAIIFENAGPFDVAVRVLRSLAEPPYGIVVFGDGSRIEQSLARLATRRPRVARLAYVGDVDRAGLRIATATNRAAVVAGLPPVEPAPGLHQAMLAAARTFGAPAGWVQLELLRRRTFKTTDQTLLAWLPPAVRPQIAEILRSGRRIPEEVLGPGELSRAWESVGG